LDIAMAASQSLTNMYGTIASIVGAAVVVSYIVISFPTVRSPLVF
jgi:hypothetical protein